MNKVALITGITGQDGSYLAEFLLNKGYEVHGIKRRSSSFNQSRIEHIYNKTMDSSCEEKPKFYTHYGDITDLNNITMLINKIKPDEFYNLAAQSHVHISFQMPVYTANVDGIGTLNCLEAIRQSGLEKKIKFYQASTSELYGKIQNVIQDENTPFYPRSPYACAKLMAYWFVVNYREAYNVFAVNGILFNHESPRRGETFVTRKITRGIASIKSGKQENIKLGNIYSKRDWGHARDYIECMWLMLQHDKPEDFVIATGETHSVKEFCNVAFKYAGIDIEWYGEGLNEYAINKKNKEKIIIIDDKYFRPTEVDCLLGNPNKAKEKLGWNPNKTSFEELVKEMVDYDMKNIT